MALMAEDYDRLAYEYLALAPYTAKADGDRLAHELRDLIAPYHGVTLLRDVNLGKTLMESAVVASKHHLLLPPELMLFFKSLINAEGLGRELSTNFDFLSFYADFVQPFLRSQYDPLKITKNIRYMGQDMSTLMISLPGQIRQSLRRLNSPNLPFSLEISNLKSLKESVDKAANILFLGIIIGSCILGSSLVYMKELQEGDFVSPHLIGYSIAAFLGFIAFINYIKKT